MLVTSSYDGTAKIWRAREGELQGDALRLETGVLFAATCLRDK